MMLIDYLKREKVVSGPLIKNSSYSHLDRLKRCLICEPLFWGDEKFLIFGVALHELYLQNKRGEAYHHLKLTDQDRANIEGMVRALHAHPVAERLYLNSNREEKKWGHLFNVELAYILDIDQEEQSIGADLKSTSCKTYESCVASFIKYGYIKQGIIYKKIAKRKRFYFIFVGKEKPYPIFILDTAMFKKMEVLYEKEIEFLLYFYKTYGNIIQPGDNYGEADYLKVEASKINGTKMAKTGKQAMEEIKSLAKEYKEKQRDLEKADKAAEKARMKLEQAVNKFPTKERELYIDQLEKYE